MIFKSQVFEFGQSGWPSQLHIMRGDIVRISGNSDQNAVEMSLFVVGGLGAAATERAWVLRWIAESDREFYVMSLRRRVGARPEEKVAEMRVYVYDTPPASILIREETDIITRRCELQCSIRETIRSVDFEIGSTPLQNAPIEGNQCNLSLSGLLPGTHLVSGRVNLAGGKGAVAIVPQQITLAEIIRLRITPPTKEINLTQEIGLKTVEIQAEPLVGLPVTAGIVILLNQKPQGPSPYDPAQHARRPWPPNAGCPCRNRQSQQFSSGCHTKSRSSVAWRVRGCPWLKARHRPPLDRR